MKIFIFLIIIPLLFVSCTLKEVTDHHGVYFLDKKEKKLTINKSNINDTIAILGPPVIKNSFDGDFYLYIERKSTSSKLRKLGKRVPLSNNALLLEFNKRGILINKKFVDIDQMNKLEFDKTMTEKNNSKNKFLYNLLSGLIQKINDPLGKKRAKVNQQ